MHRVIGRLAMVSVLLFPCLSTAGKSRLWPHAKGLAKSAAAARTADAPAAEADIQGFWGWTTADTSVPDYQTFDTTQVYFGSDGTYESRKSGKDIYAEYPDEPSFSFQHVVGTWKIADSNLVITQTKCDYFDSEDQTDCTEEFDIILPLNGMELTAADAKTLTLDLNYPDEVLAYIGATAAFTLVPPANTSIHRPLARGESHGGPKLLLLGLGRTWVTSGERVSDLRGRAIPASIPSQGIFLRR